MLTRWQRQTSAFQTIDAVEGSQPIEAMRKPKASLRLIQQPSIFQALYLLCNIEDFMGDGPTHLDIIAKFLEHKTTCDALGEEAGGVSRFG